MWHIFLSLPKSRSISELPFLISLYLHAPSLRLLLKSSYNILSSCSNGYGVQLPRPLWSPSFKHLPRYNDIRSRRGKKKVVIPYFQLSNFYKIYGMVNCLCQKVKTNFLLTIYIFFIDEYVLNYL